MASSSCNSLGRRLRSKSLHKLDSLAFGMRAPSICRLLFLLRTAFLLLTCKRAILSQRPTNAGKRTPGPPRQTTRTPTNA